jgi:hypothetical protein
MNRLLVFALTAALSTPALAMPAPHRQVDRTFEQKQSQAELSRKNHPYWQACQVADYNTCE